MPDLISRPGAVISTDDATQVAAALSREATCPAGVWRVTTNRWELWSGPDSDAALLATIDIAHNVPYVHAATLTRVSLTEVAARAGLEPESVCDLALHAAGKRMADSPRHLASSPPVFTGRRHTERADWEAELSGRTPVEELQPPAPAVDPEPEPAPSGDAALDPALDCGEDRELRRLHFLATFGGLSGGLAERYAELRNRDRRTSIREPQDDDLVVLPTPPDGSDDMEPVTGAS